MILFKKDENDIIDSAINNPFKKTLNQNVNLENIIKLNEALLNDMNNLDEILLS